MSVAPRIVVLVVILSAAACAVCASPSFRGYTGLVKIPTAHTLDRGEFDFGVMSEDTAKSGVTDTFATYSPRENLEIGVDGFQKPGTNDRKTQFNTKYQFARETENSPRFAVGLIDFTDTVKTSAYTVASKSLFRRAMILKNNLISVRGNLGVGVGDIDGVFAGVSLYAGNKVMFSAEWDSKDMNLGFRFTPVRGIRLHAAIFDLGYPDALGNGGTFTKKY